MRRARVARPPPPPPSPLLPAAGDRADAVARVLAEALPRELIGLLADYVMRPPHRWEPSSTPHVVVSEGGRSFTVMPGVVPAHVDHDVWSTRTLADGPSRWRVRVPGTGSHSAYVGIGDLKTRAEREVDTAHLGPFNTRIVQVAGYSMDDIVLLTRPLFDDKLPVDRDGGGGAESFTVLIEYDRKAAELRVGIDGVSSQLRPIFGHLPDADRLAPFASVRLNARAPGAGAATVSIESYDEEDYEEDDADDVEDEEDEEGGGDDDADDAGAANGADN
jgi:hypothetical protein